jgi:hypothetical protein
MSLSIMSPSTDEIIVWWQWAALFRKKSSPFDIGWGNTNAGIISSNQPVRIFCLSCTAGLGGPDPVVRPLRAAISSGKPILVPIFVGVGLSLQEAQNQVGNPVFQFKVNGQDQSPYYIENDIGNLEFVTDNSFDEPPSIRSSRVSAGYWAVLTGNIKSIEFGGTGGQIGYGSGATNQFTTSVKYSV